MNPTEEFRRLPNTSEHFGNVPQASEDFTALQSSTQGAGSFGRGKKYLGAEEPNPDHDRADFIIIEEAYAMFESQGERRSTRMIGEYCKNGELVCYYDSDDKRWHPTRESVQDKITKIKSLNARKAAAAPQNTSEAFTERPTAPPRPREDVPPRSEAVPPPSEDIQKLTQEIFDLKVLNKSKDMYITQLIEDREKEREQLLVRIETSNRLVGRLKNRLLQLVAPRTTRDIDALEAPSDVPSDPPVAHASPDQPLPNNASNNYEYSPQ